MKRLSSVTGLIGEWLSTLLPQASSSSPTSREPPSSAEQKHQELEDAVKTLEGIHAALKEAEESDKSDKSEQLRLSELKDVAYDAEDVMDEYEYEVLRAKVEARKDQALACQRADEVIFDLTFYHREVLISDDLTLRMREIRKRFESVTSEWDRISLRDQKRRCVRKWTPAETAAGHNKHEIFGREDEKTKIIEWLMEGGDEANGRGVSVLPIVGMGGLGKTTLAQMVYDDPKVCRHFSAKGWICASQDFDVDSLMKRIFGIFSLHLDDNMSLDSSFETLGNNGKEIFLVLDDVWNQSFEVWNSLRSLLVNIVGVGKILITTRSEHVAKIVQTTPPINLSVLSFDSCWSLFSKIAFEAQDRDLHHNFLDIGKKIVKKCAGLPLAVKVLARILSVEDDEEAWIEILESELWELDKEDNIILPALRLSYDHMPMELRPCFMYLSLFPKNYPLERHVIVQQYWMAQGFLQPKEKNKEQDIGNQYFNELLYRSILQQREFNDRFQMHDLIHDLARDVARAEYLLVSVDKLRQKIPKTIRHLSVLIKDNFEIEELKLLFESKLHLRTFLVHSVKWYPVNDLMPNLMHNLTRLRTFSLTHFYREKAVKPPKYEIINMDFVGALKHLRYLGLVVQAAPDISTFGSVYKLYHLQTLNLDPWIIDLTTGGIGDLVNLRHFYARSSPGLPHEIIGLTNLESMREIELGAGTSQFKLRHLKDMVNLREQLRVRGLNHVHPSDFTLSDSFMRSRTAIVDLELSWYNYEEYGVFCDEDLAEQVLDYLRPHPDVRTFAIDGYPSVSLPMWLGSLFKLQTLKLEQCMLTCLPTLGQLPSLRTLEIAGMRRVRKVGREFLSSSFIPEGATGSDAKRSCFLLLEKLEFREMREWEEWDGVEDVDFPRLQELSFHICLKLRSFPSLPSLGSLTIRRCAELSLPSLPSLTELALVEDWNLDMLSSRCTPMLQFLNILFCWGETLDFLDNQNLHSILALFIGPCAELRSVTGLSNFSSLQRLFISECPKLQISATETLPPSLQVVRINESPGVDIWYQHQVLKGSKDRHVEMMGQSYN